jgi:hypothetical protein
MKEDKQKKVKEEKEEKVEEEKVKEEKEKEKEEVVEEEVVEEIKKKKKDSKSTLFRILIAVAIIGFCVFLLVRC